MLAIRINLYLMIASYVVLSYLNGVFGLSDKKHIEGNFTFSDDIT